MKSSFTVGCKLKIIKYAEMHGNAEAAEKIKVDLRRVGEWKKKKDDLSSANRKKRSLNMSPPKWPELENLLQEWVIGQRTAGRAVNTVMIRVEARAIAARLGLQEFAGTKHWCHSFMRRADLSVRCRTSVGQPLPADHQQKIDNFREFVNDQAFCISPHQLGNMDEVPVPFDVVMNRTVDVKGKDNVFISSTGHEKSFFTVVLSVLASGEKLPPLLIFKRKTMPKVKFPDNVVVRVNEKGWFNNELMKDWIEHVWNKRQHHDPNPEKSLVIMDSAPAHKHPNARAELKKASRVAIIPGGLTKFVQPLDVSINKPFKDNLRKCWESWMSDPEQAMYTKKGSRRCPGYEVVAQWVQDSFNAVTVETVLNEFEKVFSLDPETKIDKLIRVFVQLTLDEEDAPEDINDLDSNCISLKLDE